MRNQYSPIIEKSLEIIKRFEEKFGWFSIRVYQFPQIDGFGTFLESVQRTLLRHRTIGWYMWARIRGTDFYLSILEEVNGQDTLNRKPTRSFRGSGSGTLINRIWSQIPFPSISRTRTMFLTGWLVT